MAAKIKKKVRDLFTFYAYEHPEWSVKAVHKKCAEELRELRYKEYEIPTVDWAYKWIRPLRGTGQSDGWLDKPWSIGSLGDPRFPPVSDGLPDLLAVWRLALIGRRPFRNRQAIWVTRLWAVIPKEMPPIYRTWEAYSWSATYAREEVVAAILAKTPRANGFVSSALDGEFGFFFFGEYLRDKGGWAGTEAHRLAMKQGLFATSQAALPPNKTPRIEHQYPELNDPFLIFPLDEAMDELMGYLKPLSGDSSGTRWFDLLQVGEYEPVLLALRDQSETNPEWAELPMEEKRKIADKLASAFCRKDDTEYKPLKLTAQEGGQNGDA